MNGKFQNRYPISSTRLKNWDYNQNEMRFNEIGQLANQFWSDIPKHFPFVELGNYISMPNPVHGKLIINKNHCIEDVSVESLHCNVSTKNEQMAKIAPKSDSVSAIIRSYI
ncbi:hypothetical protein [Flavobacterium sp. UMI-01]|uniref:hypothetical protein n=1 Tax=Flavobacterium sp. UMI-01 TaxID=1441053 RepID=UPI001C7DD2DD|nr:hypothetical protein [Flavobacterium sp. UMI-01]GIZ07791.1 hypothetical protein FUMI01_05180 [Flavobacterium sp. UMI-01]